MWGVSVPQLAAPCGPATLGAKICGQKCQVKLPRHLPQTIQRGGDTDTNAAIVGALVGALWGAAAIPAYMQRPVLEYEGLPGQGGATPVPRPAELRAGRIPDLARQLFAAGAGAAGE